MNNKIYLLLLLHFFHGISHASNESKQSSAWSLSTIRNTIWPLAVILPTAGLWHAAANNTFINFSAPVSAFFWPSNISTPMINTHHFIPFARSLLSTEGFLNTWSSLSENYGFNFFNFSLLSVSGALLYTAKRFNDRSPQKSTASGSTCIQNICNRNIVPPKQNIQKINGNNENNNLEERHPKQGNDNLNDTLECQASMKNTLDVLSKASEGSDDDLYKFEELMFEYKLRYHIDIKNYNQYFDNITRDIYKDKNFNKYKIHLFERYMIFITEYVLEKYGEFKDILKEHNVLTSNIERIMCAAFYLAANSDEHDQVSKDLINLIKIYVNDHKYNRSISQEYEKCYAKYARHYLTIKGNSYEQYWQKFKEGYVLQNDLRICFNVLDSIMDIFHFANVVDSNFMYCLNSAGIDHVNIFGTIVILKEIFASQKEDNTTSQYINTINTLFDQKKIDDIARFLSLVNDGGATEGELREEIYEKHQLLLNILWELVDISKNRYQLDTSKLFDIIWPKYHEEMDTMDLCKKLKIPIEVSHEEHQDKSDSDSDEEEYD